MPINFDDATVYDFGQTMTLEDVFRMRGAFAGIHKFSFDSLVDEDFADLSDWTDDEVIWALVGGSAIAVATATGPTWTYAPLWSSEQTRSSFKITASLGANTTGGACILFRGNGTDSYYLAEINSDEVGFYLVDSSGITTISKLDPQVSLTWPGTVELGVSQEQYSEYAQDRYLFMSLYLDGKLLLTARDHIPTALPGKYWGLGAKLGYNVEWESVRVPDLSDVITWSSLDPGEAPSGSISRALGDRIVTYFARHDGTLRAFRPKAMAVQQTVADDFHQSYAYPQDRRELYSLIRLYYATGDWVEVFSPTLYALIGHRFVEINNQDIIQEDEAYSEAQSAMRRMEENATRHSGSIFNGGFLLEPEDRVVLPSGDAIVNSVNWRVTHSILVSLDGRD